jgi:hypothetical protein
MWLDCNIVVVQNFANNQTQGSSRAHSTFQSSLTPFFASEKCPPEKATAFLKGQACLPAFGQWQHQSQSTNASQVCIVMPEIMEEFIDWQFRS